MRVRGKYGGRRGEGQQREGVHCEIQERTAKKKGLAMNDWTKEEARIGYIWGGIREGERGENRRDAGFGGVNYETKVGVKINEEMR